MPKYAFTTQLSEKEPSGLTAKVKNLYWGCKLLSKHRLPKKAFHFGGGLGDHLLCTTVFHELSIRGINGCWMLSHYPEIFQNNPYGLQIVPDDWKTLKFLERINRPSTLLYYGAWIGDIDRINPPKRHMVIEIMEKANIDGNVSVRPYWYQEIDHSILSIQAKYICVQSTNNFSSMEVKNKRWSENKMQSVVDELSKKFCVIQIGTPEESKLNNSMDFRSATISESASLLANCTFFLGQEGFPMHLARAVDTRSVIIYGGRIKAWQSGYPCNENIETSPPCSPCWQNNNCDHTRICMTDISVEDVLNAISRLELRLDENLETAKVSLNQVSKN